jgi:hypothetical protein
MRLIIILIAALWGIFAVLALVRTRDKSLDAKLTAGYIVVWPALVVILLINEPVAMWIAVPTMFGFIPWFMAGPHLWSILKDPSSAQPDEIIGIPKAYWIWGGLAAILLGLLFS